MKGTGILRSGEVVGTSARGHHVTTLRQGCLRELLKFVLLALGYYLVLRYVLSVPSGFTLGSALILSIFGYFLLNALLTICIPAPEVRAIVRAEERRPPQDGHTTAVHGPVVALGTSLRSPLQGVDCCAYEYEIMRPARDAEGSLTAYKDFRGFAYAPCAVRTSYGDINLMGLSFSVLDELEQVALPARSRETRKRAARYIEETIFSAEPLTRRDTLGEAIRELFDDPLAAGRWDYCQKDAKLTNEHFYYETVLTAGQRVTAIGLYAQEKQALMPRETAVVQLIPGDLTASRERLLGKAWEALLFAIAMVLFSHGLFVFLLLSDAFE